MSDASNFESMVQEFKDFAELKAYSNAQYNTIIDLNKQINKLKNEVQVVPSVQTPGLVTKLFMSPEEEICLMQLQILNDLSKRGSLTLEECRKVEVYSKILNSLRGLAKDIKADHKDISTEELLKLAEGMLSGSEIK